MIRNDSFVPGHAFVLCVLALVLAVPFAAVASAAEGDLVDYDQIPLLKWVGPGRPGTFGEYMQGRDAGDMALRRLDVPKAPRGRADSRVLILVNNALQPSIQTRLDTYALDLQAAGWSVDAYAVAAGTTPAALKAFILSESSHLAGCVFVGDVIAAWYEVDNDFGSYGYASFPCDLYYMDLDGTWIDLNQNGIYDAHGAGAGDEGPEVFVGRIDASRITYGSQVALTNSYFDKLHQYYLGNVPHTDHALTYTEDDWSMYSEFWNGILEAYDSRENIKAPDTNRDDYRDNRLPNPAYDFIQLSCHSYSQGHAFTRGGWLFSDNIWNIAPRALYYNLFCCSASRFTDNDCLGAAYVFNPSLSAMASIGSTKTGSMLAFTEFYKPLGEGRTFGGAFTEWFDALAPYSLDEVYWHFGMSIIGDPMVTPRPGGSAEIVVDIKANGIDYYIAVPHSSNVPITVSLDPGDEAGVAYDWWIYGGKTGVPVWWWKYPGTWNKSTAPIRAAGATLREIDGYLVYNGTLPVGGYQFFFAVDEKDGVYQGTHIDSVSFGVY